MIFGISNQLEYIKFLLGFVYIYIYFVLEFGTKSPLGRYGGDY